MHIRAAAFAAILGANALVSAESIDEYDYVIIGSGPGGGSLA